MTDTSAKPFNNCECQVKYIFELEDVSNGLVNGKTVDVISENNRHQQSLLF